jgi:hypothetical protein
MPDTIKTDAVDGLPGDGFTPAEPGPGYMFAHRKAVAEWLAAAGYKVKKSKVYKDAAEGILMIQPDGRITWEAVQRYVQHPKSGIIGNLDHAQAGQDYNLKEIVRRKQEADARYKVAIAEKAEMDVAKERGALIPRDDVELELAGRGMVLEQGLKTMVRLRADDWVHLVGGDISRGHELRTAVTAEIDQLLTGYADIGRYVVMFEGS